VNMYPLTFIFDYGTNIGLLALVKEMNTNLIFSLPERCERRFRFLNVRNSCLPQKEISRASGSCSKGHFWKLADFATSISLSTSGIRLFQEK